MSGALARPLIAAMPVLGLLQGCLPGERLTLPAERTSGRDLRVWTVETRDVGDGILVHGVVRGSPLALGIIPGHLHVGARLKDGSRTSVVESRWGSMSGGQSRMADFYATLPIADASTVAAVAVSYVPGSDDAPHSETVQ